MKIEQATNPDVNAKVIRGYGVGYITINDDRITTSMILTPTGLDTNWPPQAFADLTEEHCAALLIDEPDLVLIGTGKTQRMPPPTVLAPIYRAGVGVEIMKTAAALRTFNILTNEGRKVVAGLLIIEE
ncbi:MAG TPA: Mth938-like domain-containing protein [Gammaproteobacteria bacterium]|nr:Mth938-like domain-containing protein [Gammaproteobacteria bacterium]